MSDLTPDAPPPPIYAQPWAVRLGFFLLASMTLILGLVLMDNAKRPPLEAATETTAVGDTHFLKLSEGVALPVVVAKLAGQPLSVEKLQTLDIRDTRTQRVARDEERGLTIYTLSPAANAAEQALAGSGVYLLKTAANSYLAARVAAK